MHMFLKAATLGVAAILSISGAQAATVYTDRAAFDAAAGTITTHTFSKAEESTTGIYSNGPVTFDYSKTGGHAVLSDGLFNKAMYLGGAGGTASISSTTTALGFYIGSANRAQKLAYSFNGVADSLQLASPSDSTTTFFGIVDTAPISGKFDFKELEYDITSFVTGSIPITPPLTPGTGPGTGGPTPVDPVAGAVPEPATWAMMILGFGVVGGSMRRRPQPTLRTA